MKRTLFKAYGDADGKLVIELHKRDLDKVRAVQELVGVLPTASTVETERKALKTALDEFLDAVAPSEDAPED